MSISPRRNLDARGQQQKHECTHDCGRGRLSRDYTEPDPGRAGPHAASGGSRRKRKAAGGGAKCEVEISRHSSIDSGHVHWQESARAGHYRLGEGYFFDRAFGAIHVYKFSFKTDIVLDRELREEIDRINEAVRQAQEGTYPGFEASVKILKKQQQDTINVQKFLLSCRIESAIQVYRREEIEISERVKREKEKLKVSMLNAVEHSYSKLFESHGVLDTNYNSYLGAAKGFPARSTRSISGKIYSEEKKEKRKRPQSLPSLNLSLSRAEIAQDLSDIRKALDNK